MSIVFLILSIIAWAGAIFCLPFRPLFAPALSYVGLLLISFCETGGVSWLPLSNNMLISWLCITVVAMFAIMLQSQAVRSQTRGMAYIIGGSLVGLAIGLLGFTFTLDITALYGIMMVGVIAGIFFGFLLFSNTPKGSAVSLRSGNFFTYLLAKGVPTAITIMQIGLIFVILILKANYSSISSV